MLTYLSLSGTAVLRFGGKLCGSRARAFGEELAELRQRGINTAIVDLRECRSLDSLGIRALVEAGAGLDLRIVVDAAACAAVTQGLEALAGEEPAIAVYTEPTSALAPLPFASAKGPIRHARGVSGGDRARLKGA